MGRDEDAGVFGGLEETPDALIPTWDDYCIMSMVEANVGVCILPSLVLERIPYEVDIRPLKPRAARTLAFAVCSGGYTQLSVQRFAEHMGI